MFIESLLRKCRYMSYLYQGNGLGGVIRHIARKLVVPICQYESQYIGTRNIQDLSPLAPLTRSQDSSKTECVTVESLQILRDMQGEFEEPSLIDTLHARLEQGCIIFVARRPRNTGSGKVVTGYFLCQRGVFSALGRQQKVSSDLLFGHYIEVLPQYRGQRIYEQLRAAAFEYCRLHGVKTYCGVTSIYNRPSLQARVRTGDSIVGTVKRLSILGGLFVWETPWKEIETAIRRADE